MDWGQFLLITLIVAVAAALHASVGYGMGLLATPILFYIEPRIIPGPFQLAAMLLTLLMIWREHQAVDIRGLSWVMAGATPGIIAGTVFLSSVSKNQFNLVFGVVLLAAVGMSISGMRFPMKRGVLISAGVLAGIMGTVGAIGGPPLALVYQYESPEKLRSTISGYFIIATLLVLPSMSVAGLFGWQDFLLALSMAPGVFLGFGVSNWLVKVLKGRSLRPAVLGFSSFAAISIIARTLFGF